MQIFQTKWFARWAASEGLLELKDMAFFLYGFAKNQRDNIDDVEVAEPGGSQGLGCAGVTRP